MQFKTALGGLVSLLSKIAILIYLLMIFPEVVNRNYSVSLNKKIMNLSNDTVPLALTLDNFDLAVRVTKLGGPLSP